MKYHSSNEVKAAFADAIRERLGASPKTINDDGKRHRFSISGKKSDQAGWYLLHNDDRPAGAFGSWKGDVNERWTFAGGVEPLSDEQREAMRREQAMRQKREENTRKSLADRARRVALRLWELGTGDGCREHPYILRKRINPYGIKCLHSAAVASVMADAGMKMILPDNQRLLLVPMFSLEQDKTAVLRSVQWVDEEGNKRFLSGTPKRGLFFAFGGKLAEVARGTRLVDVCEGVATGASVHEFRQRLTVCAFDSGNLAPVVESLIKAYPDLSVTVIADNDRKTERDNPTVGNVGVDKAMGVKRLFPQSVAVLKPRFPADAPIELSDFNDLAVWLADNDKDKGADDGKSG